MEDDEHVALDPNFIPEGWLLDYPFLSRQLQASASENESSLQLFYNFPNCSIISLYFPLEWPIPSKPLIVCVITTQVH